MNEHEFRKQMEKECGKIPQYEYTDPFGTFTLEDHIRYLAVWPRDGAANKDELLDSILALCGVWTKRLDAKD